MTVSHVYAARSRPRRALAVLSSAAVVTALSCTQVAVAQTDAPYDTIQLQARTNLLVNDGGFNVPPGSSFNSITPDLNDAAQVAFRLQIAALEDNPLASTPALWSGGDGTGGIVHRVGETQMLLDDVALNEAGDIAFTVSDGGVDSRLSLYDSGTGEASPVSTLPILANGHSNPGLDEEGNVGFQASSSSGRAYAAVLDGTGTFYAQDNGVDPDSPFGWLYTPRYNDAGQIAAKVGRVEGISSHVEVRIFESDGTSERVLASATVDPSSPYRQFDNSVGLSDNGWVAAVATEVDDADKVVVRTNGTTTTEVAVEGEDGIVDIDYFAPDVNNDGQVVFRGTDANGPAVFVADGTSITRVVGMGDEVETDLGTAQLGQHNSSPVFGGAPKINNNGDVSFTAGLHPSGDNQVEWGSGVFVAYADTEPEPPVNTPPVIEALTVGTDAETPVDFTVVASDEDGDELTYSYTQPSAGTITGTGPDLTYTPAEAGTFTADVTVDDGELTATATVTFEVAAVEATGPDSVQRLKGADRYGTAAAAALEAYDTGAPVVYIASGAMFPDALTSAALAGHQDGPVLLTRVGALPPETTAALEALDPQEIVVVGGEVAVSEDVAAALAAYTDGEVTRIYGADRYGTAAALAGEFGTVDTVYLATGRNYADALAAGARAGSEGAPVLLLLTDQIPDATAAALEQLDATRLVVVGGDGVVSDDVLTELEDHTTGTVERISGATRYETAAALSEGMATSQFAYVATGQQWPDALASAALAAHRDAPVLLVRLDEVPEATFTELERLEPPTILAIGGEAVLADTVLTALEALDYTD
jgi:putative cell wall-binding protein